MSEETKQKIQELVNSGIKLPMFQDPKTGAPSVSFSLLVLSFFYATVAVGLHLSKVTDSTSSAMELFYATASLYFARSTFGTKGNAVQNSGEGVEAEKE